MAKDFSELMNKMSPERQEKVQIKAKEMIKEMEKDKLKATLTVRAGKFSQPQEIYFAQDDEIHIEFDVKNRDGTRCRRVEVVLDDFGYVSVFAFRKADNKEDGFTMDLSR